MFDLLLLSIGVGNRVPIQAHACHLGPFEVPPDLMARQAAIFALLIIGNHTENQYYHEKTDHSQPPTNHECRAHAQQEASEKDADAHPAIAIALMIKLV